MIQPNNFLRTVPLSTHVCLTPAARPASLNVIPVGEYLSRANLELIGSLVSNGNKYSR
jgi:hypothetical protein